MTGIKAIETRYAGHLFRSRIEARWAVAFDHMDVRWEYEREGFEFKDGLRYLPDFWLPDLACWFEVKGSKPSEEEWQKASHLRDETDWPVVVAVGTVSHGPHHCFANDIGHSSGGASTWDVHWYICDGCRKPKLSWGDGCHTIVGPDWVSHPAQWCVNKSDRTGPDGCGPSWNKHDTRLDDPIRRAVEAAQSARFEYGESGAPKRGLGGIPRLLGAAIPWPPDAEDPF